MQRSPGNNVFPFKDSNPALAAVEYDPRLTGQEAVLESLKTEIECRLEKEIVPRLA